jgi:hypothetical protein
LGRAEVGLGVSALVTLPHLQLEVDVTLMSADEQRAAAEVLRETAQRLSGEQE